MWCDARGVWRASGLGFDGFERRLHLLREGCNGSAPTAERERERARSSCRVVSVVVTNRTLLRIRFSRYHAGRRVNA